MKLLGVCLAVVTACAGSAIPLIPGDNSHYVEGESRYIWMPDGEGVPVLVDLKAPADEEELSRVARNGADNQYWLFTRRNPTTRQVLTHNNINSVSSSNYNGALPTKVIVHGWNNNGNTQMNPLITSAFLAIGDFNVIVVDWNRLASSGYNTAASGVPSVGQHIGNFLIWLFNNAGGNWNNLHLVGFSLGAHIVGNAGRTASGRPGRVTGLDPAGPLFTSSSNALNRNSGVYVEAIHTDGRNFGMMNAIAHADFYPNGGRNPQPGCSNSICSHGRSTELMAASIQFNHFVGRQCSNVNQAELGNCSGSTLNMGNGVMGKQGQGLYGLRTGSNWPF